MKLRERIFDTTFFFRLLSCCICRPGALRNMPPSTEYARFSRADEVHAFICRSWTFAPDRSLNSNLNRPFSPLRKAVWHYPFRLPFSIVCWTWLRGSVVAWSEASFHAHLQRGPCDPVPAVIRHTYYTLSPMCSVHSRHYCSWTCTDLASGPRFTQSAASQVHLSADARRPPPLTAPRPPCH